jgi:hypothetical protein
VHFDHDCAINMGVFLEERIEFQAAFGEEGHFKTGDASQTPAGVGDGLNESAFFGTGGLELFFVGEDMSLIAGSVVGRQQDGMAGEAGFDGVEGNGGFASFCFRAAGLESVLAIGGETGSGDFEGKSFGSDSRLGGLASQVVLFALSGAAFGTIHDLLLTEKEKARREVGKPSRRAQPKISMGRPLNEPWNVFWRESVRLSLLESWGKNIFELKAKSVTAVGV